jgi:protease IV
MTRGLRVLVGLVVLLFLTVQAGAKPVVAVFRLNGPVTESPADESIPLFSPPGVALKDLVERIEKAASDDNVKAVVVLSNSAQVGTAQVEEIRQAMDKVRSAGKEVFVHADSMGMGDYVLFSGASRLSVVPTGDVWITGLYAEQPYLRGLLDKLAIQPEFVTCGDYKSAGELFMRTGPSPEADRMMNWLVDGLYDGYVNLIASGRKMEPAKVRKLIDAGLYTAESAKSAGLVDAIEHRQQFEAMLKEKYGKDVAFERKYGKAKGPTMDLSSPLGAFRFWAEVMGAGQKSAGPKKDAVGIVYVEGPIVVGSMQPSPFSTGAVATSSDIRKALDEAANDDSIKAVVLRVNSPGGSAVASEIILDATRRVKARKPFVVSMGDIAGSGGYYVACAADTIYADESTITASIGVVAGKFITTGMWDRVGVTFKPYQRGKNAALLNTSRPFNEEEKKVLKDWMETVYMTFKGHVTAARGERLKKPLDEIAGGRVYTGRQALELGLVDKIGTLRDAVAHVASEAKLEDYEVRVVPRPKNLVELIMAGAGEEGSDQKMLGVGARGIAGGDSLTDLALPYLQHLDPVRVKAVRSALARLQLMQQEGVLLTMPEVVVRD